MWLVRRIWVKSQICVSVSMTTFEVSISMFSQLLAQELPNNLSSNFNIQNGILCLDLGLVRSCVIVVLCVRPVVFLLGCLSSCLSLVVSLCPLIYFTSWWLGLAGWLGFCRIFSICFRLLDWWRAHWDSFVHSQSATVVIRIIVVVAVATGIAVSRSVV